MPRRFALLVLALSASASPFASPLAAEPSGPRTLLCGGTADDGLRFAATPVPGDPSPAPLPATFPPCPSLRDCPGNCDRSFLGATVTDTGDAACTDGVHVFHCPAGKTIHVATGPCVHAPCCSQNPACLCPLNCGTWQTWSCA